MTSPPTSKAELAFVLLERMIVSGDLPPGALLSERRLMEITGLGRTPVREALQRLTRGGLIEIHASRGILIPPISVDQQLRLLELRRELEPYAAGLAAQRSSGDQRGRAEGIARDLQIAADRTRALGEFVGALSRAHALVAEAARNEFIVVALAPLQGLSRRFWCINLDVQVDLPRAADLHGAILLQIAAGDPDRARAASLDLNDYLVEFAYRTLPRAGERP